MIDWPLTIFEVWHYTVNTIGISFNALLIYMCIFKTPRVIRSYAVLILNFAISDFGACITDLLVGQRLIPAGIALAYISNGPCKYISGTACYVGYSLMLHFFAHSLWSLLLSFAYRYYILFHPSPSRTTLAIIICIVYTPSFFQWTTFLMANDDQAKVEVYLRNRFPNYDFDNKTITGTLNILESWQAMFTILPMTLPVTPAYCAILILRKKIIRELASVAGTMAKMSHATKTMHQQLLRALSLQACLPFFFSIAVASYAIGQLGIYNSPVLEYLTFSSLLFIPAISPLISIYFVRPYRTTIILWYYRFRATKMRFVIKPPTTTTQLFDGESGTKKSMFWNGTEYQSATRNSRSQQSNHY
ncbi:hypothetical protein WR25_00352 [Diploscapter pachys]|uniref:G-protein coupled receptors family 1 profile domain-containing protein n=1 Tax=Diploscapter pachys TaxID=2018661 RepID=A0A2A2JYX1_9BILA|nr:hypothetical protein WR25_00352 [Diploscapter pachys]